MVKPILKRGDVVDGADPLADSKLAALLDREFVTAYDGDHLIWVRQRYNPEWLTIIQKQ
jgi:hypothetical protein